MAAKLAALAVAHSSIVVPHQTISIFSPFTVCGHGARVISRNPVCFAAKHHSGRLAGHRAVTVMACVARKHHATDSPMACIATAPRKAGSMAG